MIVTLKTESLLTIADGLTEAADRGATVLVMIQDDGIKFKNSLTGHWTPGYGEVGKAVKTSRWSSEPGPNTEPLTWHRVQISDNKGQPWVDLSVLLPVDLLHRQSFMQWSGDARIIITPAVASDELGMMNRAD